MALKCSYELRKKTWTSVSLLSFSMSSVNNFCGCEKMSENMGIEIGGKMCILNWFSSNGIGQLFNILFCLGLQSGGYVVLVESTTESSKEVQ